jgi:hypothetical protein
MFKRLVVLGVIGVFLAVPPAIAKSSSNVKKVSAAKPAMSVPTQQHDGQCPFDGQQSADL